MKRILFVDDNPDILLALIDYFSNRDWITDSCGNGTTALNLLSTNEYDILVLDVTMPGMSGIEVCRRLRDEGNLIPILMLTARDSNDDVVTGLPTLTLLSTKNRCKSPITWVFSGFNVFTLRSYHSPARSRIPFIFSFSDKACLSS